MLLGGGVGGGAVGWGEKSVIDKYSDEISKGWIQSSICKIRLFERNAERKEEREPNGLRVWMEAAFQGDYHKRLIIAKDTFFSPL